MQCYNKHTFEKLGFDTILKEVSRRAMSEDAKEKALEMIPFEDEGLMLSELSKVNELRELLLFDDPFPLGRMPALDIILKRLELKGDWLKVESLKSLRSWFQSIKEIRSYMKSRKEKYPNLHELVFSLPFQENWISAIDRILDDNGNVRDNASPELSRIRKEIKSASNELRTMLNRVLRKAQENNWTDAPEITIRNDRLVIPVKAEQKGRLAGFVQDVSSTGNTVFIEPTASLQLNNRLRELQIKEQNEIVRILQEFTASIREDAAALRNFHQVMIGLDLLHAKAKLAVTLKAVLPIIDPQSTSFHIKEAYYPILVLKAQQEKIDVIPLEVTLEKDRRIMVISGPNAGGKSVSLKTVGLLQLMLQCGLLVPVDERSEFRVFKRLFLDIGDEQSVESDLSTYTSHLYQMRLMGDNMDADSLFLIDEFGSGTDPKLGGAIAEAFLERFVRVGGYGIITTHYSNIKEYAEVTRGVTNAAMQFDTAGLKPTYRLQEGLPGRSYAFEIAKRVGVHYTILGKAKKKVGKKQMTSEHLLQQLEEKNQDLNALVEENRHKERKLNKLMTDNERLANELKQKRKRVMRDAKLEAQKLIKDANKQIEKTIREIREKQAERVATKRLRKSLQDALPKLEVEEEVTTSNKEGREEEVIKILPNEVPKAGDFVRLKNSRSFGRLVELKGSRGMMEVGNVRIAVKLKDIYKVEPPKQVKKEKFSTSKYRVPVGPTQFELDVMGMRVEEALVEVEKLLDQAMLTGLGFVRILHGKGSGALRDGIRNFLRDHGAVQSLKDAPVEAGGDGWTVVELAN
jgi:DNA mismatch repair protein MutS2